MIFEVLVLFDILHHYVRWPISFSLTNQYNPYVLVNNVRIIVQNFHTIHQIYEHEKINDPDDKKIWNRLLNVHPFTIIKYLYFQCS